MLFSKLIWPLFTVHKNLLRNTVRCGKSLYRFSMHTATVIKYMLSRYCIQYIGMCTCMCTAHVRMPQPPPSRICVLYVRNVPYNFVCAHYKSKQAQYAVNTYRYCTSTLATSLPVVYHPLTNDMTTYDNIVIRARLSYSMSKVGYQLFFKSIQQLSTCSLTITGNFFLEKISIFRV